MRATTAFIALIWLVLASGPVRAAGGSSEIVLPTAEELVTMSVDQRVSLLRHLEALQPNQRDADLKMLRDEIDSLTPDQKKTMAQHFQAEFDAMPASKQSEVLEQLQSAQAH